MTHLFIAGHGFLSNGRFDPGATGFIKKGEHYYMRDDLFPAIRKYLPKGHDVVFFEDHSVVSHGDLVSLVKKYNANQVTEFHYDAASADARGGHVIIHNGYSPDKTDLALRDAIKSMVGVRYSHKGYEGISGRTNLGNVNRAKNAKITYRLLELGFGTNKADADIMVNQVDDYAKAIIKAVTGKQLNAPKVSKPAPTKTGSTQIEKTKSSGDAYIRGVQQFVVDYGFKIAVDGFKGPETKKGLIKVLQSEFNRQFGAGLAVDGLPGPKTYAALVTVRKGAKGNITKVLQALLYIAGHNPGKLDGDFGNDTEKAVRSYQKAKGLSVDGTPGRATFTKLLG